MASESLDRLKNQFIHMLGAVGAEKQTAQPVPNRAPMLRRATPGLIVAVLVWSLVFVLSVGTNGALAAALAQHLSIPPGLADAFSSLAGERDPEPDRDLSALVVPSAVREIDQFRGSDLPPLAENGSALAASSVAHVPKPSPKHGGLLGPDFMHALANNYPQSVDVSAQPDVRTRGGAANRNGNTGPVFADRIVRARSNGAVIDARSDDGPASASPVLASPIVAVPSANEPTIDSVPRAKATPDTGPASTPPEDELVTLDDTLATLAQPPTLLTDDGVRPIDAVLAPRLAVDFAAPAAALAAASVPAPGTMALLAGAFLAWPIARRMRIGAARRTRSIASPSPRD